MANTANTKAGLDALFKDVYGDKLEDLRPDFGILMDKIGFRESKKTGRDFVEPVQLTHEHGFTYGQGLVTLADVILSENDEAKIRGNSLTLRTAFAYDAAANMVSGGKEAFIKGTEYKFRTMMESTVYRLEAQMLYGGSGLGVADSSQDAVTAVTDTDKVIIPLTPASWAPGLWAGAENAALALFTTAAGTASAAEGPGAVVNRFPVVSIDTDAKSITVACKDGTEAAALVVEIEAADYDIFFHGSKGNEMVGLKSIVANTGSLYGIDGATYGLWQGNTHTLPASTNLTLKQIYQGVNRAVGKGLQEDVEVYVSPATFSTQANDEASLRRYNAASKKAETGFENIEYYGPNGKIKIVVHPMIKEGEAIAFPSGKAERIGATDITFKTPGRQDEMFQQLPDQTGYECRLYSEQALWLPAPAKCILFSNIDNA